MSFGAEVNRGMGYQPMFFDPGNGLVAHATKDDSCRQSGGMFGGFAGDVGFDALEDLIGAIALVDEIVEAEAAAFAVSSGVGDVGDTLTIPEGFVDLGDLAEFYGGMPGDGERFTGEAVFAARLVKRPGEHEEGQGGAADGEAVLE